MAPRSRTLRYGVGLMAASAAIALGRVPGLGPAQVLALFGSVFLAAWYGGLGPGLAATGLIAAVAASFLWLAHGLAPPRDAAYGVLLLLLIGPAVSLLMEALHAARRRSEQARGWLAATLASIGDAVIAVDPEGRVTFLNGAAESLTGWPADEAAGRPLGDVFRVVGERTREPAESPVAGVLATGRAVGPAEHTALIARDGRETPIHDSAAPIVDLRGRVLGVVLVFRDITREKRLEAERLEADRRKDEFLAMLAHELRNPLASIGNAAQLLGQLESEDELLWAKDVITRQVRHLARMIDDLLDVSRITRGAITLRREAIELAPVVGHVVEAVRPLMEGREHRLSVSLADGGLRLEADPVRLEQVLVNLLTNAAKYTDVGGRIGLVARREGPDAVISVRDSGIGMTPELLARAFDLFAQGDRSAARTEGGLGIGLTLVRRLVEAHGGTVAAASEGPGRGSEFTVRLPAMDERAARTGGPTALPRVARGASRVLVVDDMRDTARGLERILRLLGHDVRVAHDGPAALEVARGHRPEVVLLDIGLPGMDGYEVARRLRLEDGCRDAVIIAVSGYGQEEDRRRSREAGFDYHLVKPVDYGDLMVLFAPQPA